MTRLPATTRPGPRREAEREPASERVRRRRAPVVVAVVVAVFVVVGVIALVNRPSDVTRDRVPVGRSKRAFDGPADPGLGRSTAHGPSSAPDQRGRPLPDLGDFASPTALRQAVRYGIPAAASGSSRASAVLSPIQVERCASVVEARDPGLLRTNRGSMLAATIAGDPVLVLEYRATALRTGRSTTRVAAVGVGTCDDRLDFER